MPVHALKLLALDQQDGPQDVEDAPVVSAGEGAVDAAVVAKVSGQMVPLTPGPHPVDDAVEGSARGTAFAPSPAQGGVRAGCGQLEGRLPLLPSYGQWVARLRVLAALVGRLVRAVLVWCHLPGRLYVTDGLSAPVCKPTPPRAGAPSAQGRGEIWSRVALAGTSPSRCIRWLITARPLSPPC